MGRRALYNLEEVTSLAMDTFLDNGFHATSMDELINRTGFNRRSLYSEFGNKQAFFHHVLDRYISVKLDPIAQNLKDNVGITSVDLFFSQYIGFLASHGCLLTNAITELGRTDSVVKDKARHFFDQLEIGFIGCLEKAQQHQQIRREINIESAGVQLCALVQGLAVMSRISHEPSELLVAVNAVMNPLKSDKL